MKIALILPILLSGILFAEEKSQDKLQYETDIAFKYYADLSNTYHRCASLYTAIYGYASNTPDGMFLNIEAKKFLESASGLTTLATRLSEAVGYDEVPDIDKSLNRTMFFKDLIIEQEKGNEEIRSFITNQITTCQNAIRAYPLQSDENK